MNPRTELRTIIKSLAFASVPHLPRELQIDYVARVISREAALPVSAGLVKNWWYALDDDARTVDSRHMDWARARDRQYGIANDNSASRRCSPGSAEAVRLVA